MERHFHTIEALVIGGLGTIVLLHTLRFVAVQLVKSGGETRTKLGAAIGGVASFPAGGS